MTQPDRSHETGEAHAAGQVGAGDVRANRSPTEPVIVRLSVAQSVGIYHYDEPVHGTYIPKAPKTNPC